MGSLISTESVSKEFRTVKGDRIVALEDISIQVEEGNFVSIVGPSGCGKSTLLRIIGGLMRPSSGTVRFHDSELSGPLPSAGFVFQTPTLFPWSTILDNILMPCDIKKLNRKDFVGRARDLMMLMGLQTFEDKYPFELSGGMQQRASIARALLYDPKVLLMDEPFGALDALTREQMGFELLRIWQRMKVTTLFVTHDISEATLLSDRVMVMSPRPGKMVKDITIDLPRPRGFETKQLQPYVAYGQEIRSSIGILKRD